MSSLFIVLWSSGYVVGALALQVADPLPLLESRFVLAALITVPLVLARGRLGDVPVGRLALVGLLLQVLQFAGVYGGMAHGVPAGVSALVMLGLSPLVTTALALRAGLENGSRRRWAGLAIGAVGVFTGLLPELSSAHVGAGLGLTFVGLFGLAGGTVLQKRVADGVDPFASVAVQSVTAALVLAPALAILGGRVELGAHLVLSVAWIAAGMGVLTVLVLIRLLRETSASHVGALLLLVPAVTALASGPVLGQPVRPLTLLGMAVAGVGVATALSTSAGGRALSWR
ncbi:DMT family transporter [Solirubrobacter soli]|uniref:DMT family transporter n=1 Tax=Solirubrobacter soli TaxID=363832 RepID=UPI0012F9A83D|nr:DMT family transporter [Solirubrobacter soli]